MSGYIFKYIASASLTDTNDTAVAMPSFTTSARRITMDITNSRYFVSVGNTVQVYSLSHALSSTITQVGGSFNTPHGMCVDAANNRLLVCNVNNSTVSVINLTTLALDSVITTLGGIFNTCQGICQDANNYYVSNAVGKNISVIRRSDLSLNYILSNATLTGALSNLRTIAIDNVNNLYCPVSQSIIRTNVLTGASVQIIGNGIEDYRDVCIDVVSNKIYIVGFVQRALYTFNLHNLSAFASSLTNFATGSYSGQAGLCINHIRGELYLCNGTQNKLDVIKFK